MSLLDDGSNSSLLVAGLLLFVLGAALQAVRAVRSFEPNAELPDSDDITVTRHDPWNGS